MEDGVSTSTVIVIFVVIIVVLIVFGVISAIRTKEKVTSKVQEGAELFKKLLKKEEFKTLKSAVSYNATIHRNYHIEVSGQRTRGTGIRSSCDFCKELIGLAEDYFRKKDNI